MTSIPLGSREPAGAWMLLVSFAALAMLVYATIFYPGAMGFDVAYQWWQSRGGETTNIHGSGMTWLWRLANFVATGPGPLFILQLSLLFAGAVLIAGSLSVPRAWKLVFLALAIGAPVCFVQFSSVVSDVMLAAVLCCALGVIVLAASRTRAAAMLIPLVMVLLFLALLLRKNALPAVFPLLVYAIHVTRKTWANSARLRSSAAIGIPIVAVMQLGCWMIDQAVDRRVTILPGTTLWDLAAISIQANEILLPPATYGSGMTVDDLGQAFVPYANTTLFANTHAGMRQPFLGPDDPLNHQIQDAWIGAIIRFPRYYLRHRWQVTRYLFGSKPAEWPHELVYYSDEYRYDNNPVVARNETALHRAIIPVFERLRSSNALAAWPYLVVAFAALAVAWPRRRSPLAQGALAACASGLMYALPLPLISPSAELRYLAWTCLSAILGAGLALSSKAARASRPLEIRSSTQT